MINRPFDFVHKAYPMKNPVLAPTGGASPPPVRTADGFDDFLGLASVPKGVGFQTARWSQLSERRLTNASAPVGGFCLTTPKVDAAVGKLDPAGVATRATKNPLLQDLEPED